MNLVPAAGRGVYSRVAMSVRVRTHANPLRRFPDLAPPPWTEVFADPALPFAIEFGCAKGEFLVAHARSCPGWNILGVEVRKPVALDAVALVEREGQRRAAAAWGNIAGRIREFTPAGRVDAVYAFFPDPWFKNRHAKRRLFQVGLVDELAAVMPPAALVHVLTDQPPLVAWTREIFEARSSLYHPVSPPPLPARSPWEEHCLATARPYERLAWVRTEA